MDFQRWIPAAQEIAERIAAANAAGDVLDNIYLFVDPETNEAELTNTTDVHVEPFFFGALVEFDPYGLLTVDDAKSNYILQQFAEMIEDAVESEYYDEEEDDDE